MARFQSKVILCVSILASLLTHSPTSLGQSLPAGVTAQMAQQFQNMPRDEQQAFAKQYGIELPAMAITRELSGSSIGAVGEQLEQIDVSEEEYTEEGLFDGADVPPLEVLQRYGVSLFDRDVSTFAPTDDALVPDEYRLGVGDQLIVHLYGKENDTFNLSVGRDGSIQFPKLGSITVSGLTFEDSRALIDTRVRQQLIGVEAVITLGRLRAIGVFMAGEVRVPGAYSVSALTTVTQALFQAGGVTDIGSLRNIQVRRSGKIITTFDIYDLLMRGDPSGDIRLQSADVLFVPTIDSVVEIRGEVRRPMAYELSGGETVANLIDMAGGFTKEAFGGLAVLVRTSLEGGLPIAESLNLTDQSISSMPIRDGDILTVPSTGDTVANGIKVEGAVYRPGIYGWRPGLRVSDLLSNTERDLLPAADLTYSLIIRIKNEVLDVEVIEFSLMDPLFNPGSEGDPALNVADQVIIFSMPDLTEEVPGTFARETLLAPVLQKLEAQAKEDEPLPVATISGAVKAPGKYPLLPHYDVDDIVKAAGGFLESADASTAEIRRRVVSANGSIEFKYYDVEFDYSGTMSKGEGLESRDIVTIREVPDWNEEETIDVRGAVVFPGTYVISPGETISSVVKRAGGLTDYAFPDGAIFNRVVIARREAERARAFAADIRQTYASRLLTEETTTIGFDEIFRITEQLESVEGRGRLLIDLPAALAGSVESDYEVEDGDELIIPRASDTISVVGEVRKPGTHLFQAGLTVEDYIALSAGVTMRSDQSAIYIVRANGVVAALDLSWWRFSDAGLQALRPGDSIVVPVNSQHKESLAQWREITQILYQSLVSVAAVARL